MLRNIVLKDVKINLKPRLSLQNIALFIFVLACSENLQTYTEELRNMANIKEKNKFYLKKVMNIKNLKHLITTFRSLRCFSSGFSSNSVFQHAIQFSLPNAAKRF